jgi:hypothetical protein
LMVNRFGPSAGFPFGNERRYHHGATFQVSSTAYGVSG